MKTKLLIALTLLLSTSFTRGAEASLQSRLDIEQGHSLGIGMFGLSYDYGFDNFSLGASISSQQYGLLPGSSIHSNFITNLRGNWRLYNQDGLQLGLIGGTTIDSGFTGDRSYLKPDIGLGMAYQFKLWDLPMALRLNIAWTVQPEQDFIGVRSTNFLQRVGLGPSTGLEVAFKPSEKMEFTLGGGSIMGMRLRF